MRRLFRLMFSFGFFASVFCFSPGRVEASSLEQQDEPEVVREAEQALGGTTDLSRLYLHYERHPRLQEKMSFPRLVQRDIASKRRAGIIFTFVGGGVLTAAGLAIRGMYDDHEFEQWEKELSQTVIAPFAIIGAVGMGVGIGLWSYNQQRIDKLEPLVKEHESRRRAQWGLSLLADRKGAPSGASLLLRF